MAEKKSTEAASTHTKAQLLSSQRYANRQDILTVLLVEGKNYTTEQVDKLVENFMKGQVN